MYSGIAAFLFMMGEKMRRAVSMGVPCFSPRLIVFTRAEPCAATDQLNLYKENRVFPRLYVSSRSVCTSTTLPDDKIFARTDAERNS